VRLRLEGGGAGDPSLRLKSGSAQDDIKIEMIEVIDTFLKKVSADFGWACLDR